MNSRGMCCLHVFFWADFYSFLIQTKNKPNQNGIQNQGLPRAFSELTLFLELLDLASFLKATISFPRTNSTQNALFFLLLLAPNALTLLPAYRSHPSALFIFLSPNQSPNLDFFSCRPRGRNFAVLPSFFLRR